jgi:hypothetical protein
MHLHIAQYIDDNREHIIESWLTEAEVPTVSCASNESADKGIIPESYLSQVVEQVSRKLREGHFDLLSQDRIRLNSFLGHTCACRDNVNVCTEIRDSGYQAFLQIFNDPWDSEHEFDATDRAYASTRIGQILTEFFNQEIQDCSMKTVENSCPHSTPNK